MALDLATLPIVDTHQHLWNLDLLQLAWLKDPAYRTLACNALPGEYAVATKGYNIVRSVYVEVDAQAGNQAAEASYIAELASTPSSRIGGAVFGARPNEDSFANRLNELVRNPLTQGVREVLFDRPLGHCTTPDFVRAVQNLGEQGLIFEIEIPPAQLGEAFRLINDCPGTRFVLDHCGHPILGESDPEWERAVSSIADRPNAVVKISGLFSGAPPELCNAEVIAPPINHLLEVFGSDRVLFGSDWPVVNLSSSFGNWLEAVWQVVKDRPTAEVHKLLHDNAVAVYRLA